MRAEGYIARERGDCCHAGQSERQIPMVKDQDRSFTWRAGILRGETAHWEQTMNELIDRSMRRF